MAKFKEIIKLQKINCYYLTNLWLIQRTRSNDHSETDIKDLLYKTYRRKVGFDTFWSTFNWSTFWYRGSTAAVFWPTTFRACIVRAMIGSYTTVPYSPLWPGSPIYRFLKRSGDCRSSKTRPIMTTICACPLLGVPEVHTKCPLSSLIFFFFNILAKVQKWYACQFDLIFLF